MEAVCAFSHIEDDGVGVELRGGVTIHRASGVMLELRGDELACRLGGIIPTDAGLRVLLQFVQGNRDGGTVGFADAVIATDQGGQ